MCAQQTAADMPSAGLNIAELADQYTRPVHGIGHQYRLTREEQEDAAQSTWLALCQTPIRSGRVPPGGVNRVPCRGDRVGPGW